ncbi:MAG: BolA family protein [Paracoccaceae bacterium]
MRMEQRIRNKLTAAFEPAVLRIDDDSEKHRGHGGYREGGETHFSVTIRAAVFDGMSRVARQRAVYAVLREEMAERIHALALDVGGLDS